MILENTNKIKVLFIDDEVNNLVGFKASFRKDFEVLLAGSAHEGLQMVNEHPDLHVIICDQRMPDMTGVDFFEKIVLTHPDPVRILATGYTDIEAVVNAINKGHVFRYLTKPFLELDIKTAIEQAYKFYLTTSLLRQKNDELLKANEELDKFAYSVTHDIRGPIVSILGAIEIMSDIKDVDELHTLCLMMEESAKKVNDLIENIHAYYNLKHRNIDFEEINFNHLCEEIRQLYNMQLMLARVKLDIHVEQENTFRSNNILLQLIINNLLSNAIKYQKKEEPNKFVAVSIQVKNNKATLKIKDNGIGIEEKYLELIFTMFFRASNVVAGSGFGLYNVKDAISKLNGEINVTSIPGEGTEFIVTIPGK